MIDFGLRRKGYAAGMFAGLGNNPMSVFVEDNIGCTQFYMAIILAEVLSLYDVVGCIQPWCYSSLFGDGDTLYVIRDAGCVMNMLLRQDQNLAVCLFISVFILYINWPLYITCGP